MMLSSAEITKLIASANLDSTREAARLNKEEKSYGKLRPVISIFLKFISSFQRNDNKAAFKDRITYSALASLFSFLTFLKLLKLKKII